MQEQPELVLRVAQNARRMRELLQHIAGLSVSSYMVEGLWRVFACQIPFCQVYAYTVTLTTSNAHKRSRTQPGAFHLVQPLWIGCLSESVA